MMAADCQGTLNTDPVTNIFRTFSQLSKQAILTRLEICERAMYAERILYTSKEFDCHIIIFPVEIGPQTYPHGWNSTTCQSLYSKSYCTVCIFGDRGFGIPNTSFMDFTDTSKNRTQTISFPYFGSRDDNEALHILSLISPTHAINITIYLMTCRNEHIDKIMKLDNNTVNTEFSDNFIDLPGLLEKLSECNGTSLIMIGHKAYTNIYDNESVFQKFIDDACTSSFMIVHSKPDNSAIHNIIISSELI
jgi:hypothetical protein